MKSSLAGRITAIAGIVGLTLLAVSSTAAAQVTLGQLPAGSSPPITCEEGFAYDEVPMGSAAATYTVHAAGVITSWSTNAAAGSGQNLTFKVFRPTSPITFTVVAHDGPHSLTPGTLNTFSTSIPVQVGDIIGLNTPGSSEGAPTACIFSTPSPLDADGFLKGNAGDGATVAPEAQLHSFRLNVAATLLSPPTVSGISPTKGSVSGGKKVVVTGGNFASVSGVTFGSTAAKSFTVESEGQLTAEAPASLTLSKVPVTVTTVAGSATSTATFAYEGCKVPNLRGKKLKVSKRKSRKADCKIGTVKKTGKATLKTGEVTRQNPKPGKILAPGTKIKVTLGV